MSTATARAQLSERRRTLPSSACTMKWSFPVIAVNGTPEPVPASLRCHIGANAVRPSQLDQDKKPNPLLVPSPDRYLPGGNIASLQRTSRGNRNAWGTVHEASPPPHARSPSTLTSLSPPLTGSRGSAPQRLSHNETGYERLMPPRSHLPRCGHPRQRQHRQPPVRRFIQMAHHDELPRH